MSDSMDRLPALCLLWVAVASLAAQGGEPGPGYDDTPLLPNSQWRVHDRQRPRPPSVTGAQAVVTPAPSDAIVLFSGNDLAAWTGKNGLAAWKVAAGYFEVNGTGDIKTQQVFGDCQLHLEWCTPESTMASQGRSNSGVFLMDRYEIQILDSHDNITYADGQAGAIYGQTPPLVNACLAPGVWQSYDILFTAPRFEAEQLVTSARVTVIHNGVLIQNAQEILGGTAHKSSPSYRAHAAQAPLRLQDHGNPVRFRNIWVRRLDVTPAQSTGSKASAAAPRRDSATHVVEQFLRALQTRDRTGAESWMTQACQQRERSWKKSFTNLVCGSEPVELKQYTVSEPELVDGGMRIRVRATFMERGKADHEGMRIDLVEVEGGWWIREVN